MSRPKVDFDTAKARADVTAKAMEEIGYFAGLLAREIRKGAPRGEGGRIAQGVRVYGQGSRRVVYVPHPSRFLEFGHSVVVDGKKAGRAPARPFVRPAVLRAAARFAQSSTLLSEAGGSLGEFAGLSLAAWLKLGPAGGVVLGKAGRRAGTRIGGRATSMAASALRAAAREAG